MSSFLLNLARRAAGLPVGPAEAPLPPRSGPDARAPDLDASDAATPTPRPESWTGAFARARTAGEALPRSPAVAVPAPMPPPRPPTPMAAEPSRPAETALAARTLESGRQAAPPTERAVLVASPAPPPRPPRQTEPEPAPLVISHPVAEVADVEPTSSPDDGPDVSGWAEGPPAASVAQAPKRHGLRMIVPEATPVDWQQTTVVVRPAAVDLPAPPRRPPAAPATSPARATPPPVHIRIGRIEIRGTPPAPPRPLSSPGAPATLGFAAYARIRTYRAWLR